MRLVSSSPSLCVFRVYGPGPQIPSFPSRRYQAQVSVAQGEKHEKSYFIPNQAQSWSDLEKNQLRLASRARSAESAGKARFPAPVCSSSVSSSSSSSGMVPDDRLEACPTSEYFLQRGPADQLPDDPGQVPGGQQVVHAPGHEDDLVPVRAAQPGRGQGRRGRDGTP